MAEKKKGKKRKEEYVPPGEEVVIKPAKEEYTLAKWMRKNVPIKKTKFLNHNVEYFTAKKAVDALMESKWAQGDEPRFKSREEIVDFLHKMLENKFYHRARKVRVSELELRSKGGKKDKKAVESGDDKQKTATTKEITEEKAKPTTDKGTDAESSVVEGKPEPQTEKEKRKQKVRLEMHNDQIFKDGLDAYVWIYDPIPFHYWIIGTFLVLGAIGVCLFPLWPPSVRLGVYYLSIAAAGFLVFIIILAVIRLIIFCLIWMVTLGKHNLWILPNLTEDVGFFASFWPLYTYEYKDGSNSSKTNKGKKKKKDKDSDAEEDVAADATDSKKEEASPCRKRVINGQDSVEDDRNSENGTTSNTQVENLGGASESESESSQRSSTGKDFEMLDQDELES